MEQELDFATSTRSLTSGEDGKAFRHLDQKVSMDNLPIVFTMMQEVRDKATTTSSFSEK